MLHVVQGLGRSIRLLRVSHGMKRASSKLGTVKFCEMLVSVVDQLQRSSTEWFLE